MTCTTVIVPSLVLKVSVARARLATQRTCALCSTTMVTELSVFAPTEMVLNVPRLTHTALNLAVTANAANIANALMPNFVDWAMGMMAISTVFADSLRIKVEVWNVLRSLPIAPDRENTPSALMERFASPRTSVTLIKITATRVFVQRKMVFLARKQLTHIARSPEKTDSAVLEKSVTTQGCVTLKVTSPEFVRQRVG